MATTEPTTNGHVGIHHDDADGGEDARLSGLFDAAHEAVLEIETSDAASHDAGLQRRIGSAIKDLEWATLAASRLDLFSANEEVEELPTSSLKFFLLPAYLGRLTNKKAVNAGSGGGAATSARRIIVDMTVVYLEDFLTRLSNYGVYAGTIPTKTKDGGDVKRIGGPPDLNAMNAEREAKIRRFKEGKEREERLTAAESRRKHRQLPDGEERKYWLETIDDWACKAFDDLKSLKEERDILDFMAQRSGGKVEETPRSQPAKFKGNPFAGRPFILTRDALQKQVFGMGYPSLPSMTVEEWYEEQAAAGLLPTPDQSRVQMDRAMGANDPEVRQAEEERKAAEEDEKEEEDDEEARRKKIEWDDWKDDHRRGWGNRKNMG